MIKYKLICKNCDISFDSWFASSKEYEKLKKNNFLSCHNCQSKKIEKTLMAPKLINKSLTENSGNVLAKTKDVHKKIKEFQKFIKNNFDYVGKNFAYEARLIHYDKKKKTKGIYGTASKEEMREMKEEGIRTELMPWVDDKSN